MKFTLYSADCINKENNCSYPHKIEVTDSESFKKAVCKDYVCAEFKNNYRNAANFISSDCIALDCDNSHSDKSEDWVTPEDVRRAFPGVSFAVHYSRNHKKQKGSKAARARFHLFFPVDKITDADEYKSIKLQVNTVFPYIDANAVDVARFFFGTIDPVVALYEGTRSILDFLLEDEFDSDLQQGDYGNKSICEGSRNTTMSHYAGRILKRYGNTEEAYSLFLAKAEQCSPPLEDEELKKIWNSAVKFGDKVAMQEGYIPPAEYNAEFVLKPTDYSDVGQAMVLAREYGNKLRYSPSTGYIVFNGSFWEESDPLSQDVAQELTTRQLAEAETEIKKRIAEMEVNGAFELLAQMGDKKALTVFNEAQTRSYELYQDAVSYKKYAIRRRDSKYIFSALKEVRPMVLISQDLLDTNEFLLNTPEGTFDLRKGTTGMQAHNADDYITKQTAVGIGNTGAEIWQDALDTFFCKDKELIDYVQRIVGLAAVGKVYVEALIIAYGEGRNGKSTFWNVISRVLGSYSGNISADVLTVGCKRNVKPELAEAKGKRLLIAAELEEGMRLNTSNVKQLCSTDEIYAEKKYKAPFSYIPSHTLVLYTNHLPKVGAIDKGTWRRLIVIPFEAKIESRSDIKNYADYLFENAGSAILMWIINGARKVIATGYHISPPAKVQEAIRKYKDSNDWLSQFITECCEVGTGYQERSGEVYTAYRSFCVRAGEFTRSTTDFYTALESSGFIKKRGKTGSVIYGLRLKSEFLE